MRVTDSMLFQSAVQNSDAARTKMEEAINAASTGLRVTHPGDDPVAAGLVTQAAATQSRAEAVGTGAQRASDQLAAVDSGLNDVTNALARAREIGVQFANAGYTAAQRASAADEVKSLQAQIVASLNAKVDGRYLMGGTLDGTPPFDAAGNYAGDANVKQVEIAPGVYQDASVRADVALKGVGGGVDLFATLGSLQTALLANDQAGVAATLTPLDSATSQVSTARSQAGNDMNAFDTAVTASQAVRDGAKTQISHLVEADAIQANTDLALAQRALQASLTATSSSFQFTLLNYLK
jgi:flagellar hook-associated protein 3 FlgL